MFEDVRKLLADQLKIEEETIAPESRIKEDFIDGRALCHDAAVCIIDRTAHRTAEGHLFH